MINPFKRISNLYKLSGAEVTVNYSNEVKLKAPQEKVKETQKLATIIRTKETENDSSDK